MAICLLYKGQVFDALEMLKNLPGDPNEPVAINFSIVAELSISSSAHEDVILVIRNEIMPKIRILRLVFSIILELNPITV